MGQIVVLLGSILGTYWVHVASIHCLSKIPFLTLFIAIFAQGFTRAWSTIGIHNIYLIGSDASQSSPKKMLTMCHFDRPIIKTNYEISRMLYSRTPMLTFFA